ncbi:MAG: RraA family protein [Acidimicrobiales bacterium]
MTGDLVPELLALGSATLGESGAVILPPRIRPVWRGASIAAPVVPVRCSPGDNLAIHVAVATAPPGSALVVDVGDVGERGYWGEVLTTAAQARLLAGLVIDGGVRDVGALESLQFPVFSSTVALRGATKRARGSVGGAVTVAGVVVSEGDWVVGDVDGVVIIARADLDGVMEAARTRSAKEIGYFGSLRSGTTTVELLDLDASLVEVTGATGHLAG